MKSPAGTFSGVRKVQPKGAGGAVELNTRKGRKKGKAGVAPKTMASQVMAKMQGM